MKNHLSSLKPWIAAPAFASLILAFTAGTSSAAPYYLQANQTSVTFDNLNYWFDQTDDGGTNPTTLNGNDFFSNGFQVRTGTSNFTFGNASTTLTLNSGNANRLAVRAGPSNIITIPNLISEGGGARIFAGQPDVNLVANNFTLTGGATRFDADTPSSNVRTLNLTVGTLVGDGDMELHGDNFTFNLNVTNGIGYTGDIIWSSTTATLSLGSDFTLGGGLIAPSNARIDLNSDVTFASVTLAGNLLDPGTYSYDFLSTNYESIFLSGGAGSITVVPEPGTSMLLLFVGITLLLGRRTFRRTA